MKDEHTLTHFMETYNRPGRIVYKHEIKDYVQMDPDNPPPWIVVTFGEFTAIIEPLTPSKDDYLDLDIHCFKGDHDVLSRVIGFDNGLSKSTSGRLVAVLVGDEPNG